MQPFDRYVSSPFSPLLFLLFSITLLPGCSLFDQLIGGGEPAATADAPPPAGYAPIYVRRISPFTESRTKTALSFTRVDASDPSRIRIYAHLLDSTNAYLTGASTAAWQRWLCDLREVVDGVERPVTDLRVTEVTEKEAIPHAIALVMDHSGSMGEMRAKAVQNAVYDMIGQKKDEDEFALVKYDDEILAEVPLTRDQAALQRGLGRVGLSGFGGLTAIGDGILEGIRQVAMSTRAERRAVIIFTDGLDNSSSVPKDSVIAMARRLNVAVLAVDFGTNTDAAYLREVAAETGGSYYRIYATGEFAFVFDDIYRRLRNYYLIEYTPSTWGERRLSGRLCLQGDTSTTSITFDNTPEVGSVALLNVYFDVARSDLKSSSTPALQNVVAMMKAYPGMTIELRGHTDSTNSTGDPDFNQNLSQARAEAVRTALVARGIASGRVRAVGYGDTRPVATNTSAEGRARNRRTEFVITGR